MKHKLFNVPGCHIFTGALRAYQHERGTVRGMPGGALAGGVGARGGGTGAPRDPRGWGSSPSVAAPAEPVAATDQGSTPGGDGAD